MKTFSPLRRDDMTYAVAAILCAFGFGALMTGNSDIAIIAGVASLIAILPGVK